MIACTVEREGIAYIVSFEDRSDILLQSDYDQAAFAVACGLVKAPESWDGRPSKLGKAFEDCDLADITECPEDYHEQALQERSHETD